MESIGPHASIAEFGDSLSDAKRALLYRRLRGRRLAAHEEEIPSRPVGENPMSFGQERLWFQCQVSENPALFNIAFLAHIDGHLDIAALEASINDVIARHEVLRAGFANIDGAPQQFFQPLVTLRILHVDLTEAAEKALSHLKERAQTEARSPFDLAAPPLMRVTLFKLAPQRHALLFVVHHIVWDGWSSGVLIDEITKLYEARHAGGVSPLRPLRAQYADYAHWHRALIASEAGERQIEYWRARLEGLPERISLPTDRPRQARQSHSGAIHEWRISTATLDRITALARTHNVTQFAILLAAYNVLLMHYSGQRDFAVGAVVACRTRPAFEPLVGFFANALTMRASLDDDPTFEALIARTQQTSVEAQCNQDAPFEMLVERLAPRRNLSHNPLFQVAIIQHHLPTEELRIDDLRINFENLDPGSAPFDLAFHIYKEAPGLRAVFEYDLHLFDARTIGAMARHFDILLDHLIDAPQTPVSQARLFDKIWEAEEVARSRTVLPSHPGGLLQSVLDGGAPEAIAIACGAHRLTYGELSVRSNQLAHYLRAQGVEPDTPVAMLIGPSVEMIVAAFGILKADGAYVPIDPTYPLERIRHILSDCGAKTLITSSTFDAGFSIEGVNILRLDCIADTLAAQPHYAPAPRAREDNCAYLIYTSGSTGLSKGVMIPHRSAVASTRAREQFYADRVSAFLLLSSISFDSSVAGIFWTLAQGGVLRITTESERRNPAALEMIIAEAQISHLLCLPSLYGALLDVADSINLASLRCCIVAGETCRPEIAEKHFEVLPDIELVNEYGPTECAVWSSAHRIEKTQTGSPAIGRPIPGTQAVILGVDGRLAPQGALGELCIGGAGLARGYMGRPDLTAERFTPNPYGPPGARLYRTGDRARLNADGDIEFLGRLDEQLKIRGYRVDPREIEFVMLQHPSVAECHVVAQALTGGATLLVACCRTHEDSSDEAALKLHASQRLPAFMIPDRFVRLEATPRLPNGKVDRCALSEVVELTAPVATDDSERSVIEILVADIWRDVLGAPQVNGADNFFELGGNSLAAIQVVARVQRMLGSEIPVNAIFESVDLAAFAKALEGALGADFESTIDALLSQIEEGAAC